MGIIITSIQQIILGLFAFVTSILPSTVLASPSSVNIPVTTDTSRNWSGYVSTAGNLTAVTASWTVPSASSTALGADAVWVGIGGVSSRDLIQAGTQNIVDGSGQTTPTAFYEMLPAVSQTMPIAIHANDSITTSLAQTAPGQWQISLKDNTDNQSFNQTFTYSSSLSSAEWIMEAPTTGRRQLPLDNFNSVTFNNASVTQNGRQLSIAQANGHPVTMISSQGQPLTTIGPLAGNGNSFTISRTAAVSIPALPQSIQIPGNWHRRGDGFGRGQRVIFQFGD